MHIDFPDRLYDGMMELLQADSQEMQNEFITVIFDFFGDFLRRWDSQYNSWGIKCVVMGSHSLRFCSVILVFRAF